jgi:putative zinc finger/helix-turn-helix YgiT family protein
MNLNLSPRGRDPMPKENRSVCPLCGKGELADIMGDFKTRIEGPGGRPITLIVPNLSWRHCGSCKEDLLAEEATAAITAAHRAARQLLPAEEIRSIRQHLGKTQAQMSDLLGIGEKTYCRWESGTHFQSEAFDRYLRAIQASPELVHLLNDIRRQKETTLPSSSGTFEYLEDISAYESTSERFTQLLRAGCFQLQSV